MSQPRRGSNVADPGRGRLAGSAPAARAMLRTLRVFAPLALLAVLSLAVYQNCTVGAQKDEGSLMSQAAALGFAYTAKFDQVAYMSCSALAPNAYDSSAYFTVRAGAYRSGGLGYTDSFYQATKNFSAEQRSALLALSPMNSGTAMQAALRAFGNVQTVFQASAGASGRDYATFFDVIGQPEAAARIQAAAPGLLRTLPPSTGLQLGSNRFEATLTFGFSDALETSTRQHLQGLAGDGVQTLLALTYAEAASGGSATRAKSPGDPNSVTEDPGNPSVAARYAYGRGLTLGFRRPSSASVSASYQAVVLQGVSELNLESLTPPPDDAAWVCPDSFQFRIVRLAEASLGGCPLHPDPDPMSPDLQAVRRSLRVEDWWVHMDDAGRNYCIVPKKTAGDCYGGATGVQYNLAGTCGGSTGVPCTAFASICYRSQ